jgi:hypothetical protein
MAVNALHLQNTFSFSLVISVYICNLLNGSKSVGIYVAGM